MPTKPPPGVMVDPFHQLSQGCTGHWLFNEGAGSLAHDLSMYGNHGTLTNMLPNVQGSGWSGSKFGGGLAFNGSNNYVDINNAHPELKTQIGTVEAWVNTTAGGVVFASGNSVTDTAYMMLMATATEGREIFFYRNGALGGAAADLSDGNWHHLVWQSNGSKWIAYADGVESPITMDGGTNTGDWFGDFSTNTFAIGVLNRPSKYGWFTGSLDFVRVWNRVLSAKEIKQSYHNPFCNLMQVPAWQLYSPVAGLSIPVAMHHYEMLRA